MEAKKRFKKPNIKKPDFKRMFLKLKESLISFGKALIKYVTDSSYRSQKNVKIKKVLFAKNLSDGLIFRMGIYILLIILGFIFIYPIISMIVTSLKDVGDLADSTVKWIPGHLEWANYKEAFTQLDFFRSLGKTCVVVLVPSLINTVIACLTAYGFSKFNFPGKKVLFAIMLATFIIPKKLTGIPQYAWFNQLKLLGTLWTYILPSTFGQGLNSALGILVLYSSLNLVPRQLEESAKIDGCSNIGTFFKIVLPLIVPTLITVFLFNFVWYWNDSTTASMYLNVNGNGKWTTLLVSLSSYQNQINAITNGGQGIQALLYQGSRMAATFLSILPLLLMYFVLQRYFVESVEKSGITGE